MEDFKLIVKRKTYSDDLSEGLKSTSTLEDMVRKIKNEYNAQEKGLFSLQNRLGWEIYNDNEENDSMTETLESFFGPNGAEITYVPINAGWTKSSSKNSIVIWNALKQTVKCFYEYEHINLLPTFIHHKGHFDVNVAPAEASFGAGAGFEETIKKEKFGPDKKGPYEILIGSRSFFEVPFEDQAKMYDFRILIEDKHEFKFPSQRGKAFIIFKDAYTRYGQPPKFVAGQANYCNDRKKFDWKTLDGYDCSNDVEKPPKLKKK